MACNYHVKYLPFTFGWCNCPMCLRNIISGIDVLSVCPFCKLARVYNTMHMYVTENVQVTPSYVEANLVC